jgi:hypothetical protein
VEPLSGLLPRIRPRGPRWAPGGSVEPLSGLLAQIGPRGPQMAPKNLCETFVETFRYMLLARQLCTERLG